mmetsp:Transcript_11499/g.27053  ORF Transcript_11499/g.27053 Transcript_11499/m.27053 type:complete len:243 (+) Transcript_11499:1992-2720(+)
MRSGLLRFSQHLYSRLRALLRAPNPRRGAGAGECGVGRRLEHVRVCTARGVPVQRHGVHTVSGDPRGRELVAVGAEGGKPVCIRVCSALFRAPRVRRGVCGLFGAAANGQERGATPNAAPARTLGRRPNVRCGLVGVCGRHVAQHVDGRVWRRLLLSAGHLECCNRLGLAAVQRPLPRGLLVALGGGVLCAMRPQAVKLPLGRGQLHLRPGHRLLVQQDRLLQLRCSGGEASGGSLGPAGPG